MFNSRLHFWKEKGLHPTTIYDIGANTGDWTRNIQTIFPNINYELFEANNDNSQRLQDLNHHIILLGEIDKTNVPFYKIRNGFNTGDSKYLEVSSAFQNNNYSIIYLDQKRLDSYVVEKKLPLPDLIKIDVQGAELDVLKGMGKLIDDVKYFIIEVSLHRWNKDSPMIEEIIDYMFKHNFYFIDVLDNHVLDGYLFQIDILFCHSSTQLRKENFYK
jgi:FkbM family methyltransferase